MVEPVRLHRVADHEHSVESDPGAADLGRLPLGDADDPIHPAHDEPVERLVEPDLSRRGRPAMRDRDDRDTRSTRGEPAEQVGLVTMADQHVGPEPTQLTRYFAYCRPVVRR